MLAFLLNVAVKGQISVSHVIEVTGLVPVPISLCLRLRKHAAAYTSLLFS